GVMTITSLVHEVMPLVRYFTGDVIRVDPTPCACGHAGPAAEVLGRCDDVIEIGGGRPRPDEVLDAPYDFADGLGTRIFFVVIRRRTLHLLIELPDPGRARDAAAE